MEKIELIKGAPIASRKRDGYTEVMKGMEIGDSFLAPISMQSGFNQRAKKIGIKITRRRVSDTECQIWRVE